MMQVQKGQVKYKDRTDIICTYGVVDNGKQYYFLDGEKLGKGRIVASTALVEAIDPMVSASNIGVIDSDGNVIIPFEYKAIKPVADKAMIVENVNPVTPSVIEAAGLRKDPLAATRLVTTPATIKEKVNAKMGPGGRFLFNDQFSEASVYDLDGKNLLDNKLYSFIGYNNGNLYLANNTPNTDVLTYSFDKNNDIDAVDTVEDTLDVKEMSVPTEVIDEALSDDSSEEKNLHPVEFNNDKPNFDNSDFPDVPIEDVDDKEVVTNDSVGTNDLSLPKVDNDMVIKTPVFEHNPVSLFNGVELEKDDKDFSMENKNDSLFSSNLIDSTSAVDDSIIEDTATVMSGLIDQNKRQKRIIAEREKQIDGLLDFKKKAFGENKTLVENNESLKKKVRVLEKESLSSSEKIAELEREIQRLKSQVAGKDDLAKLIADAKNLLGDSSDIEE